MQTNKFKQNDHRFDRYIQNLRKQGLIVHPALKPAIFTLNNNLQYPGLTLTQPIKGEQNLVLVPVKLLLTAHKALQQEQLKSIYQQQFYHEGPVWQDRILITYLLYLYWKKQQQNIWYQMVSLFAKQIDILSFWQQEQLQAFKDNSIVRAAQLQRDNFQKQWIKFEQVKQSNCQFFNDKKQVFTKQNYKWVYIHTISRCFGSFMNSTYFTPFCQFFNHHCVDVSYNCATKQEFENQISKKCQKNKRQLLNQQTFQNSKTQQQIDHKSQTSSVSSGNSIDYIQQGDFNYWEIQSYKIKWGGKISFDLKDKQTKQIQKLQKQIYKILDQKLIWNGWNFCFIGQAIQKINIIKNEYLAGRKKFIPSKQEYQKIKAIIQNYKTQAIKFHRIMGYKYDIRAQTQQNINNLPNSNSSHLTSGNNTQSSVYAKTAQPPTKQYLYFKMQAGQEAQFNPNQQIYFCYGRISNRTMLVRYGCCIQQNRYDHVWLNIPLNKVLSPYPDLFDKVQQKGLPVKYKLKLRPNIFQFQLYLWFKSRKFQLTKHQTSFIFYPNSIDGEMQVFQEMIPLLQQKLAQFKLYPQYDNLKDQKISYHEYFMRVYHWQKIKIIQKHLKMVSFVLQQLNEMKQMGNIIPQKEFQKNQFGKQLKGYWTIFKKGIKL